MSIGYNVQFMNFINFRYIKFFLTSVIGGECRMLTEHI
jgi:hypothetical protein